MPNHGGMPTRVFIIISAVMILACASTPTNTPPQLSDTPLPASRYQSGFRFSYSGMVETAGAVSEEITIAVVEPDYRVKDSALETKLYSPVGRGFSSSMGVDMQKILVGKGMTVKGPFSILQDITYSEKKESHLTLAPQVYLDVRFEYVPVEKDDGTMSAPGEALLYGKLTEDTAWAGKMFQLTVNGYFAFRMQEPMSGETMWIKKIPLDETVRRGMEVYEAKLDRGWGVYRTTDKLLQDQKPDTLADIMADYYQLVLTKLQTYIEVEELYQLKKKTKEIRELKRY